MLDYYDKILVGIAGSLLGGVLLSLATAIDSNTGVLLGALLATPFIYDAMFRNPPLPATDPKVAAAAIVWHGILFVLAVTAYMS
ncbi:uncharacterized protein Nmag_3724 (plasmid) [Natrialba magadii ATCC 43099]|uniref:Uncharacterized protein n=1 Tax=Natrialba magadii (strain ATCC 43099 / DSM 3394 / CCM 3739 / CIP 104546 / IAM 13178 / JCM 8861 / NBRC 102185 / NCIMB 2190 / MS3) TaxID=547559 RepID=D3T107_NATMM|nr:hypothetical protein [Natrialba magadii]ADD07266.1 uncharacterized protein Nmag_3724 [Natrialba magadii ATCC 43099]ELY34375.1 hypothetical protein C500_00532 [Natrialba magadii ATCC 43099]